jgi:hypothetical protein
MVLRELQCEVVDGVNCPRILSSGRQSFLNNDNKPLVSIKGEEFLEKLSVAYYLLLKKDSAA